MGAFDKLRKRLEEFEEEAEAAAISVEDLASSDDELLAELDAELEELGDEEEAADEAAAATEVEPGEAPAAAEPSPPEPESEAAPATEPAAEPAPSQPDQPRPPQAGASYTKGRYGIDPERAEDLLWDLELVLLEADVATDVALELRQYVEEALPQIRVEDKGEIPLAIEATLREAIVHILEGSSFDFDEWMMLQEDKPVTIMFVGVNGTGKTTTIARLAHRLKDLGFGIALAAGDTFRAGAIEQLEKHGNKLGLRVIKHSAGSDPAAVAYDAVEHAKARKKDVILLDTAGRMQTNSNLMDEMKKIDRVAEPELTVFVGDSLAGNDAIEQAKTFDEAIGVDCCVLTKVDTDAKGGAALSIAREVGKPIAFLGVGQNYDDLIPFDPNWLLERIFGE